MPKATHFKATEYLNLEDRLEGKELISLSIGPAGELFMLAVTAPADYRETSASGINFPKIIRSYPQDFTVIASHQGQVQQFEIQAQRWNYHHVQCLPNNEVLLVGARSQYRGDNDYDLNAKVFSANGSLVREFLLGDGIKDVQVTIEGQIWTSYSDEGIFGNFDWRRPVGVSGLILWNSFGEQLYRYTPPEGLDWMAECYALNVTSSQDTWCYYYTEFPLVHIRDRHVEAFWRSPVEGAGGFALGQDVVLFKGSYQDRDRCSLFRLTGDGGMKRSQPITL